MSHIVLVRYGSVPEVARFVNRSGGEVARGESVVVRTHRGLQLGEVLETIAASSNSSAADDSDFEIVRIATSDDRASAREQQVKCEGEFYDWCRRIVLWNLSIELIDLEQTLDGKRILYVLTERGPATTTLALQAAAAGLGIVEVQPVSAAGLVSLPFGGGCGSGGCGCSH